MVRTTYVGGMIGLLNDGDKIIIDAENGSINVELDDNEIGKKRFGAKKSQISEGTLEICSKRSSSQNGVTHPGAFKEKCYAYLNK